MRQLLGVSLPGLLNSTTVQLIAFYGFRLPGQGLMLDPVCYGILVHRRICLRAVVEPCRPVAGLTAVVAITVIHCTVVVVEIWIKKCLEKHNDINVSLFIHTELYLIYLNPVGAQSPVGPRQMIHCLLFRTSVYCSWYLTQLQYPAVLHMSLQPHVKPNSKLENTFKYKAPSCGRMCSIQKK